MTVMLRQKKGQKGKKSLSRNVIQKSLSQLREKMWLIILVID